MSSWCDLESILGSFIIVPVIRPIEGTFVISILPRVSDLSVRHNNNLSQEAMTDGT